MARDKTRSKHRILDALEKLLVREGFRDIGINRIAREAGVDKVLIYRYFGGLKELLAQFALRGDFWPTIDELLSGGGDAPGGQKLDLWRRALVAHLHGLRRRPITQEIMRWELTEQNELTDQLALVREEQGMAIMQRFIEGGAFPDDPEQADLFPAVAALLHAGLTYLVLRSKTADVYLGVSLKDDAGYRRIENALDVLLNAYARDLTRTKADVDVDDVDDDAPNGKRGTR